MSQSNDMPRLPLTWTRFKYLSVSVPSLGSGASAAVQLPALAVRLRPPNNAPGPTWCVARARGQLDTGAAASAVPIWLLRRLGIPLDKKTRRQIYSVSGKLWAYGARVGMEILCGGSWLDLGESDVLVPDTPWSRDPRVRRPLLLGLNGFFDKVRMYIDHSRGEFWLELPTG